MKSTEISFTLASRKPFVMNFNASFMQGGIYILPARIEIEFSRQLLL